MVVTLPLSEIAAKASSLMMCALVMNQFLWFAAQLCLLVSCADVHLSAASRAMGGLSCAASDAFVCLFSRFLRHLLCSHLPARVIL